MMYTLNVHHAGMSAALRRAMAKCQRPATGSAAYGALGPSRATGGGKRAGAELLRHAQGAVRGPDATVRQGARGRRDARSCAHHRDGIPASGTRSSPSTGAGGGADPRTARGPPWRRARCALALWSIRRGAASRPAAGGTWWSTARHDAPVPVTLRPPGRASRWRAAAAGERAPGGAGGGRTRFVAKVVCLTSTPARLSWGCTPSHALVHALARHLARSL